MQFFNSKLIAFRLRLFGLSDLAGWLARGVPLPGPPGPRGPPARPAQLTQPSPAQAKPAQPRLGRPRPNQPASPVQRSPLLPCTCGGGRVRVAHGTCAKVCKLSCKANTPAPPGRCCLLFSFVAPAATKTCTALVLTQGRKAILPTRTRTNQSEGRATLKP